MLCEIITEIKVKTRTYENTFNEPVPLEEEGLSRKDVDPEDIVILCEECSQNVYPMDWVQKEISHGKIHVVTLSVNENECVRCLSSTRRVVNPNECEFCLKKENKKKINS